MRKKWLSILMLFFLVNTVTVQSFAAGCENSIVKKLQSEQIQMRLNLTEEEMPAEDEDEEENTEHIPEEGDGETILYAAEVSRGNGDGSNAANAIGIDQLKALTGTVNIKVVGTITLPETMPAANITFAGADETATVKTQNYVSFHGNTIFTDVNYNSNNFTYMFADGYDLTFTESVNATATGLKIFGGGKQKDVTGNPTITVKTAMAGADIFGGGWTGKLTGNPTINISGAILSNVYGGGYARGKSADVEGSPTINLNNCNLTGTNYIVGGGFVELSGNITADVSGTVTIKADTCVMNTSGDLYLGSRVTTSGSSATIGELNAEFTNSTLGKRVFAGSYCAGKNSTTTIDKVSVQFGKVSVNGDLYAGGYTDDRSDSGTYSAAVNESTVTFTDSTATKIFGGGYQKGADVTTSKLTVKNIEDVTIFAGGYNGYSDVGSCEINVENTSSKGSGFNMVINGGGGNTPAGTLYDTVDALTVNFNGTNTVKTIRMVENILINEGAVLTQLDTKNLLFSEKNLNGNLTIEKDAQLVLKGTNEIHGNFSSQGNLKNTYDGLLLVGGTVTSAGESSYTSTGFQSTYENNYPFLAAKTDSVNPAAGFLSTDEQYRVENRGSDDDDFKTEGALREWYLVLNPFRPLTVSPVELTKYVTGSDHHSGEEYLNCFPNPRIEGIDEDSEIKVAGNIWNLGEHNEKYPFQINYYEIENGQKGDLIRDDHIPGDYIASIEPSEGIKLEDIRIDGRPIEVEDGILHIRRVSNIEGIANIDDYANTVVTEIPDAQVNKATAVVSEVTRFLVNNLEDQLPNSGADIRLLYDDILPAREGEQDRTVLLTERLEELYPELQESEDRIYKMKYLDLIDAHDSNLWVSSTEGCTIYLPYPEDTDMSTEFKLYHFKGMHRDNDMYANNDTVIDAIKNCEIEEMEIERTASGIKFKVGRSGFSPFALTWIEKENGSSPVDPPLDPPVGPVYTSVTVNKIWNLDDGGKASDSVTVHLLRNGSVYDSAELSDENQWSKTWHNLEAGFVWTVEETDVPEGFTAELSHIGNSWTIVNDDIAKEPEKPGEPETPEKPGEPENPDIPDKPDVPGKPVKPDQPAVEDVERQNIPQTGDENLLGMWVIVLSAVITAMITLKKRNRK